MTKKIQTYYHYYTLIAVTIIFLSSLILLNGPVRVANLVIITPLTALAWINFTNPYKINESLWSLRMLVVVFCLTLLGLFTFALPFLLFNQASFNQAIEAPTASPSPSPTPSPTLSPSPITETVTLPDVKKDFIIGSVIIINPEGALLYSLPDPNSLTTQTLPAREIYPYLEFRQNFFKIIVDGTQFGWVKLEDLIN